VSATNSTVENLGFLCEWQVGEAAGMRSRDRDQPRHRRHHRGGALRRGGRYRSAPPRAAHEAFLKWREVPVVERVQPLYRYQGAAREAPSGTGRAF